MEHERYHIIDGIRGLTIISMIFYHACWDLVFLAGVNLPGYMDTQGLIWQRSICCSFIIISGFCAGISNRHFKRGIIVFLAGLLVTLVTVIFMPEDRIVFGILTFLGSSMLIIGVIGVYLKKVPYFWGLLISIILFLASFHINNGYLGFFKFKYYLPDFLYSNMLTTFLGFMRPGFFSTDYFSIIPWFFLFCFGFYISCMMIERQIIGILKASLIKPLEWMGRHSLLIYLMHQPLLYLVMISLQKI